MSHHHPMIWLVGYSCFSLSQLAFSNREFACGKCLSTSMLPVEISLYQLSEHYMSFLCSVNHLLFFVSPLHPLSCLCSSCSSPFTTCMSSCSSSSSSTASMLSCSSCSCCSSFGAHMSSVEKP